MTQSIGRIPTEPSAAQPDLRRQFPYNHDTRLRVEAPVEKLFAYLDDHSRLASHMSQSSWMMAGSRMDVVLDAAKGQAVGSRITLQGRVLGLTLHLEEVVTERTPPCRKAWQTVGSPRLLVIGDYRMGFEITAEASASHLRVFIDYALPDGPLARWLGRLLGGFYARWCTGQMAGDAARAFARHVAE